jgi:hypothetical protein
MPAAGHEINIWNGKPYRKKPDKECQKIGIFQTWQYSRSARLDEVGYTLKSQGPEYRGDDKYDIYGKKRKEEIIK